MWYGSRILSPARTLYRPQIPFRIFTALKWMIDWCLSYRFVQIADPCRDITITLHFHGGGALPTASCSDLPGDQILGMGAKSLNNAISC